jgi:hypothetical protein
VQRGRSLRRPSGLLSWRYFWPPALGDPRVAAHRRLWLGARGKRPMVPWLARELLAWLRWSIRHARRGGPGWTIPAHETRRFGLAERPDAALDHVYDCETSAFHAARNPPEAAPQTVLLADKLATAHLLAAAGVPTAPVSARVPQGTAPPLAALLPERGAVFCKARSGSGGRGAFAAWRQGAGLAGRRFEGGEIAGDAVEAAWAALARSDDALVQPLLRNHAALAALAADEELITIRYITRFAAGEPEFFCASIEIPAGRGPMGGARYAILPLDASSGALLALPDHASGEWRESCREARARAPDVTAVPHWAEIAEASHRAHRAVPALWAVAWDWAVTPDGPVLLEGNAAWALATPQLLLGPALLWEPDLSPPARG